MFNEYWLYPSISWTLTNCHVHKPRVWLTLSVNKFTIEILGTSETVAKPESKLDSQ